jgi:hypothetical protein
LADELSTGRNGVPTKDGVESGRNLKTKLTFIVVEGGRLFFVVEKSKTVVVRGNLKGR